MSLVEGLDDYLQLARVTGTRVESLADSLELDSNRIYALPTRRRQPVDYQATVDVFRFDGRLGGDVQLNARWAVLSGDGDTVLVSKVSQIGVAIEGSDHGAFVAAQSLAVMRLGREIAGAVTAQMRWGFPESELRMMSEHPQWTQAGREAPAMAIPAKSRNPPAAHSGRSNRRVRNRT